MKCPSCQHENPPEARFCMACGQGLAAPASGDSITASIPSGERRQATIVFSDLSGYTAMNERLDPEEVQEIMSRIKAEAVRIVEAHGGIVNQFVGDEVVALFGIPTAHEDDPVRAVRASLELHSQVRNMSTGVEARIGQPLRMHTGINTGLIVTHLEDERDGRYGLTGDTVNTGARLLAKAETDEILVSPDTNRLIAPFIDTVALEAVEMRGKAKLMVPYRIVGEAGVKTRFEAAQRLGLGEYTGREAELAALGASLKRARSGQGWMVTLAGEAGVGKSRLLHEFLNPIENKGVLLLRGRCLSQGANTPYFPFLDLLRRWIDLGDTDTPEQRLNKTVKRVVAKGAALTGSLPFFLHLLSIKSAEHPLPAGIESEKLGRALREVIVAVAIRLSADSPLVVVLEDWHWADESSQAVLKELAWRIAPHPILLAVLFRPGDAQPRENLDHHTHLELGTLNPAQTERIVGSTLKAENLPEGLAALIHERTGGNPFFTEEVCRALTEEGAVMVTDGRAELARPLESLSLPATVQAVIQSRLDRLGAYARETVRVSSVIGREFASEVLERIAAPGGDLTQSLENLQLLEIIFQTHAQPEAAYLFKHVVTQQVAYETLLLKRRRELHALVGQAIETLHADDLEPHYEELAHHYSNSDDHDKAVEYLEKAVDKAWGNFSMAEAVKHIRTALNCLDDIALTPEQKRKRIHFTINWFGASQNLPSEELVRALGKSKEDSMKLKDRHSYAQCVLILADLNHKLGMVEIATGMYEENIGRFEELNNKIMLGRCLCHFAWLKFECGEFFDAVELFHRGLKELELFGYQYDAPVSASQFGVLLGMMGCFPSAIKNVEHLLNMSKHYSELQVQVGAVTRYGQVCITAGNWPAAVEAFSQSINLSGRIGVPLASVPIIGMLGYATFFAGDRELGFSKMKEAIEERNSVHFVSQLPFIYGALGEISALAGKKREAIKFSKNSLKASNSGILLGVQIAHRALAIAATLGKQPDWEKVKGEMNETFKWCEERGAKPDQGVNHFRYAEIMHKKGDLDAAREQLNQATALFRQMEMTWWAEQAEALRGRIESGAPFKGFAPYGE